MFPRPVSCPQSTVSQGWLNYLQPFLPLTSWARSPPSARPPPAPTACKPRPMFHFFSGPYTKGYASPPFLPASNVQRDCWGTLCPEGTCTPRLLPLRKAPAARPETAATHHFPDNPAATACPALLATVSAASTLGEASLVSGGKLLRASSLHMTTVSGTLYRLPH